MGNSMMAVDNDVVDISDFTEVVYSVSQLNHEVRERIESGFGRVWIEGEISNFSQPSSGHMYFTLKDASAQVRCAMFRGSNARITFRPANGMQVLCCVEVSIYEPRGEYQLIAQHMEPAGDGKLRMAFEQLKQRLQLEGLFDPSRKKPLPLMPARLGIITSPTGAAIRDVLTVLKRRYPGLPVLIFPVAVQGEAAAPQIAAAIDLACERGDCDVLLVTRGGGSLEDLWAFNEEVVARAIARASIPIVSAVGHEIDFTIADFVADLRAPTPSAAAELISPDGEQLAQQFVLHQQRLEQATRRFLRDQQDKLNWTERRLQQLHPGQRLRERAQRVDELEQRLNRSWQNRLASLQARTHLLDERLNSNNPRQRINTAKQNVNALAHRLAQGINNHIERARAQLSSTARALEAVSPLATLGRGYAIARDAKTQAIIRDAEQVSVGDIITTTLSKGQLECRVERKFEKASP